MSEVMDAPVQTGAPPAAHAAPPVDFGKRIEQYIALRAKIKEIEKAQAQHLKPFKEMLDKLGDILLSGLTTAGTDSTKVTGIGTAYKATESSATIEDAQAFRDFIISGSHYGMVDWKANKTSVRAYLKANEALPPGVKFTQRVKIGVRRDGSGGAGDDD